MKSAFIAIAVGMFAAREANGNGRPPLSNGVVFKPGDPQPIYVATTFGLLVSPDACHFYWLCENNIGYGGEFDPIYGVTREGTILATTFHGLRASHDGGCSFTSPTSELPTGAPGKISDLYPASLAVGPTDDIWIGTSDTGSGNAVYRSQDDAASFEVRGVLPTNIWFTSILTTSDPDRVYVGALEVATGNGTQPVAHWYRSDDSGATWLEQPLVGVELASQPVIQLAASDPSHTGTVYMIARLTNPPRGDRLYRTTDGGMTLTELLATDSTITGVVIRDTTVEVATLASGLFESIDGGATFVPVAATLQFGCLGLRADGTLLACASDYDPDLMALGVSSDARTWTRLLRFEYITGPLDCPSGTAEHDICEDQLWGGLGTQLGGAASACAAGPDLVIDMPPGDVVVKPRGGCCDAQSGSLSSLPSVVVVIGLRRRRRPRARSTSSERSYGGHDSDHDRANADHEA